RLRTRNRNTSRARGGRCDRRRNCENREYRGTSQLHAHGHLPVETRPSAASSVERPSDGWRNTVGALDAAVRGLHQLETSTWIPPAAAEEMIASAIRIPCAASVSVMRSDVAPRLMQEQKWATSASSAPACVSAVSSSSSAPSDPCTSRRSLKEA